MPEYHVPLMTTQTHRFSAKSQFHRGWRQFSFHTKRLSLMFLWCLMLVVSDAAINYQLNYSQLAAVFSKIKSLGPSQSQSL